MIRLLYRLLSRRVRIRPACFSDHRQQWQIDRDWQLRFDAKVRRNLMARETQKTAIHFDPDYIPEFLREQLPAILRRQAA